MSDPLDIENAKRAVNDGFTSDDGLLFDKDGRLVALPAADRIANHYGFVYVERLIKIMEVLPK